jgi:hypothetical protein
MRRFLPFHAQLDKFHRSKNRMPILADDQVVMHRDPERLSGRRIVS